MPYLSLALVLLFLFSGCAKSPGVSKASVVTFKTASFRVHDTAFVTVRKNEVEIAVYTAGTPVLQISSGSMMCINRECLSDDEFTAKYLSPHYPPRMIETIVNKQPLGMKGASTREQPGGFVQEISSKGLYDIRYVVKPKEVFFRDRLNRIIIAIKDMD